MPTFSFRNVKTHTRLIPEWSLKTHGSDGGKEFNQSVYRGSGDKKMRFTIWLLQHSVDIGSGEPGVSGSSLTEMDLNAY